MSGMTPHIDLLLRLLEAPDLRFTHHAVVHHGEDGQMLLRAKLLIPFDYEDGVTDNELGPIGVSCAEDQEGMGYRDAIGRWISVSSQERRRYRVDWSVFAQTLFGGDLRVSQTGQRELVSELVWELGTARLGRSKATEVWFARRLSDHMAFRQFADLVARRPATTLRLVLTSTEPTLVRGVAAMCCIVSLTDVLDTDRLRLRQDMVASRLSGRPPSPVSQAVHLSDDGRLLMLSGTEIRFRGKMRLAINYMVGAHKSGKSFRAKEVLEACGSSVSSLDKLFGKKWRVLRPHLQQVDGAWSFKV